MKKNKKPRAAKMHCEEILCAGFGGQGIMFMGKLLAEAGLAAGKYVTWMPAYGAEVRGGTAYSVVKISDEEIANPISTQPNIVVVMNRPSLLKYEPKAGVGCVLITNRSLIGKVPKKKGITLINISMTDIASKLGNARCANMVALGAVVKCSRMLSIRNVIAAIRNIFKNNEDLFLVNKKALEKGYRI